MKTLTKCLIMLLAISMVVSCKNNTESADKAKAKPAVTATTSTAGEAYKVDVATSMVRWTGNKPTGDSHQGTISITGGTVKVANGTVTGGEFMMDMGSLVSTDLKSGEGKEKLEGHLKSGDFFEVEKYPTGKFVITGAKAVSGREDATHEITGNLTLKDKTHSITFPAHVGVVGDKVMAQTPKFMINRTTWGVSFNSGILGTAKDMLINDDVALVVTLNATK
ncbi:MAG: YceI family protein [Saprospiraceae bacterium]